MSHEGANVKGLPNAGDGIMFETEVSAVGKSSGVPRDNVLTKRDDREFSPGSYKIDLGQLGIFPSQSEDLDVTVKTTINPDYIDRETNQGNNVVTLKLTIPKLDIPEMYCKRSASGGSQSYGYLRCPKDSPCYCVRRSVTRYHDTEVKFCPRLNLGIRPFYARVGKTKLYPR